jgi:hypothetical protein
MSFHMGVWARFAGMVILLFDRLYDTRVPEYNYSGYIRVRFRHRFNGYP